MRRSVRLGCLVAALALVAVGCGGDGDGGARTGGELEVAAVWTGPEQERFQEVLDEFEQRSGTQVTYTSTGNDIPTVLRSRISGGQPPGVAILPQPGLMRDLVAQDALQPIADVVGDEFEQNFSADWRELGSVDGTLYGVFFKGANKSTVWYNVHAFEDAGVERPETFDEMLEAANTLKASGVTPFSIGGSDAWTLTDWFENIYLRTAGPEKYDQLAAHEIPWTDESVKVALREFGRIVSDRTLVNGDPAGVGFVPSVDAVFKEPPDAAMVFEGDFVPGVATVEATAGEDFDFFPFPRMTQQGSMVVGAGDVAVMLTDTPQSRALVEFLSTPEAAEIWARRGGFASPNSAVDASVYPDEITRRTATALVEADVFRFDMSDLMPSSFGGTPARGLWSLLQEFVRNPSDVDGVAQRLETEAAQAYQP